MPSRKLLGCQRLHDQIGSQAGRFIPADPRPPHCGLDRIDGQHRAVASSSAIALLPAPGGPAITTSTPPPSQ
jgi:hypothetical protein